MPLPLAEIDSLRYCSEAFLDDELAHVFSRSWLMAGLSSRLPATGSRFVFESGGGSYLVLRDSEGKVKAFYNGCLHRGTKLVCRDSTDSKITCPYHGWSYDLQGRLCSIPKPKGMKADLSGQRLRSVPAYEMAGLIWLCKSKPKEDIFSSLGRIHSVLVSYQLGQMVPIQTREFRFPVNWKVALENALDYYHVPKVHGSTVGAHVQKLPTFDSIGDHSLQTLHIAPYGWRKWVDARSARGGPYNESQMQSLHKFFIFPNLVLNVLPYHLTVMQLWPDGVSSCKMRYLFCMRSNPGAIERLRAYSTWLASRWILYEDVKLYPLIQQGMELGGTPRQLLHEEERAISHFHSRLNAWIPEPSPITFEGQGQG
jgi:choline monooxygenase